VPGIRNSVRILDMRLSRFYPTCSNEAPNNKRGLAFNVHPAMREIRARPHRWTRTTTRVGQDHGNPTVVCSLLMMRET